MRDDVRRICQPLAADGPLCIFASPPLDNPNNPRPEPGAEKTHLIESHRLAAAAERTGGFV